MRFQLDEGSLQTWLDLPEWYDRAACRGLPQEMFFLDDQEDPKRNAEKHLPGLWVCRRCPVSQDCLEEALRDRRLDVGIRGGMTSAERRRLRQRRLSVVSSSR